ncbi:MAG: GMP synthase [Polymorphum sp.]|nr:GMP synthase [Polymorphum sp.]
MSSILIIQTGTPPADLRTQWGEQGDWFRSALEGLGLDVSVVQPHLGEALPEPADVRGAAITGSWSMVSDREDWSERTADWIRSAMAQDLPLFGVCYGHQLMAHALGGRVDYHPGGPEVGQLPVTLSAAGLADAALAGVPQQFDVFLTHEQSVLELPAGAEVLARSAHDPHQILRYGRNALSVQFHPEFFPDLMRSCIERRRSSFEAKGADVEGLLAAVSETPVSRQMLRQFCAAAAGRV